MSKLSHLELEWGEILPRMRKTSPAPVKNTHDSNTAENLKVEQIPMRAAYIDRNSSFTLSAW